MEIKCKDCIYKDICNYFKRISKQAYRINTI